MGPFQTKLSFGEGKLEQLLLWGTFSVLLTAERYKEKKENSETNKKNWRTKYKKLGWHTHLLQ